MWINGTESFAVKNVLETTNSVSIRISRITGIYDSPLTGISYKTFSFLASCLLENK